MAINLGLSHLDFDRSSPIRKNVSLDLNSINCSLFNLVANPTVSVDIKILAESL